MDSGEHANASRLPGKLGPYATSLLEPGERVLMEFSSGPGSGYLLTDSRLIRVQGGIWWTSSPSGQRFAAVMVKDIERLEVEAAEVGQHSGNFKIRLFARNEMLPDWMREMEVGTSNLKDMLRLTTAIYHQLGRLADRGEIQPWIPEPKDHCPRCGFDLFASAGSADGSVSDAFS